MFDLGDILSGLKQRVEAIGYVMAVALLDQQRAFADVRAVADLLTASVLPLSPDEIAARFTARGPWKKPPAAVADAGRRRAGTGAGSGRFAASR